MITNDPFVNPQNIDPESELALDYVKDLQAVSNQEQFAEFVVKYDYWLDDKAKAFRQHDWNVLKPRIDKLRAKKGIEEDDKDLCNLLVPIRLLKVFLAAQKYGVPWGCAYLQMRRAGAIDY